MSYCTGSACLPCVFGAYSVRLLLFVWVAAGESPMEKAVACSHTPASDQTATPSEIVAENGLERKSTLVGYGSISVANVLRSVG